MTCTTGTYWAQEAEMRAGDREGEQREEVVEGGEVRTALTPI